MSTIPYRSALIVGAGSGISGSLARQLREAGLAVVLGARNTGKLATIVRETGAVAVQADAADPDQVAELFDEAESLIGSSPHIVIYNASGRVRGPITDVPTVDVERALAVTALGAFYTIQQAARRMQPAGHGAILLTGATAGVKGFAHSAAFAMGKFALRGLAQSAARELGPAGIHVAHFIVDGGVRPSYRHGVPDQSDSMLDPDAIAQSYLSVLAQPRSAWTNELDLRPWVERF